jgi:hypothetical protein
MSMLGQHRVECGAEQADDRDAGAVDERADDDTAPTDGDCARLDRVRPHAMTGAL